MSSYAALIKAIEDRWDDAGLTASLGTLYRFGGSTARSVSTVLRNISGSEDEVYIPGPPQEKTFPRCEFMVDFDALEIRSASSHIKAVPVIFQVFVKLALTADNALDTMSSAFVDSESASTNPLDIVCAKGGIVAVDPIGGVAFKIRGNMYVARLHVEITWSEPR